MTRPAGATITQEDRRIIYRHLKKQGIEINKSGTNNESLAAIVARFYKIPLPVHYLDRAALLRRFAREAYAAVEKDIVPSREPIAFRPLTLTREARYALERTRELYPVGMDHLGA